jgi:hypothetical protein
MERGKRLQVMRLAVSHPLEVTSIPHATDILVDGSSFCLDAGVMRMDTRLIRHPPRYVIVEFSVIAI